MLAAVILSGGASRRMGTPKALLPYRGGTFLEHLLKVTDHPRIGWRRVVLGADAVAIAESVQMPVDEVVINENWEDGQLSSIQAGVRSLPEGTDGMVLCLIDHPLISREMVNELVERFYEAGQAIVLPVYKGRRGHPVIFAARLYEELLNAPLETGARAVVWAHSEEVCEMETSEEGCVLNLNDPDALAKARERDYRDFNLANN
jgi:molybdenum cofactor cytidylyltransferase